MQENIYLPSSSERKRAITAYLLVGVLFFSGKEDLSVYEYYHFKQAIGRYSATMFVLLLFLFISIIPFVRILAFIPGILTFLNLIWIGFLVYFAWRGAYVSDMMQAPWRKKIYADIGGRMLNLFDIKKNVYGEIANDTSSMQFPPIGG